MPKRNSSFGKERKSYGAVVHEVGGTIILEDPDALAVLSVIAKHNCKGTLELNSDRIKHFKNRFKAKGLSAQDAVIVVLNVDDLHGGPLAENLMPGYNWQEIRDRGEKPFARGLAVRDGIEEVLQAFDNEAANKLKGMTEISVVVVDHGVAEVFTA